MCYREVLPQETERNSLWRQARKPAGKKREPHLPGPALKALGLGRDRGDLYTPAMSGQGGTSQNDIPRKTAGRKGRKGRSDVVSCGGPVGCEMAFATRL